MERDNNKLMGIIEAVLQAQAEHAQLLGSHFLISMCLQSMLISAGSIYKCCRWKS